MAGKFKYANPEYLINPLPGQVGPETYSDPVVKAAEIVGPQEGENYFPQEGTISDALQNANQIKSYMRLLKALPVEEARYGKSPEELISNMNRDSDRGYLSKTFDYISKPFRYETSVFTSPIVAALEAYAKSGKGLGGFLQNFSEIYPQLQKETALGEREVSVYDALRRMGMSNWGALPLGIAGDILLSPSTYTGVGGLTKLGKLAKTATYAGKAGDVIEPASKIGAALEKLTAQVGAEEASSLLKLAPTLSEQAALGQRALLKFAGQPIITGEGVFKGAEGLGDIIRNQPELFKLASGLSSSFRPKGVSPEAWSTFQDLKRMRRGEVGLRSKELLEELENVANQYQLEPGQLEEIFYALSKGGDIPWDKVKTTDVPFDTALSAIRAKYPGISPNIKSLDKARFDEIARQSGIKEVDEAFMTGDITGETVLNVLKDKSLSPTSREAWEASLQGVQEGKNIFSVLPKKLKESLAKSYGVDELTPELAGRFGADWEKFISGNEAFLDSKSRKWIQNFIEKEGGHLKIRGVTELELPDGSIRRIVGDIKFVDEAQEAVRMYTKTKFKEILDQDISLGILNKSVDDYVPGIYRLKAKPFRAGKEFSTEGFFTKEKMFKSPAEAEQAGYEPVKNILELVGIRGQKSIQAQESAKMLDEAASLFGIPTKNTHKAMSNRDWALLGKKGVNPENYRELTAHLRKEGYVPINIGNKEYYFQPEIAEALNKMVEPFTNESTMKMISMMYDQSLNVWKGYVTAVNPKFHFRNFASNNFLLYLKDGMQGLNPIRHKMAYDVLTGKAGQLATDTGKMITYDEIRDMIQRTGLRGSGFMGGELSEAFRSHLQDIIKPGTRVGQKLNPLSSKNAAISFGRKVGTAVEDEAKVVGFINDLIQHGNPTKAAENTFKYLYDYMDLTSFEKNVAKRLIPFWTWMSKNIPNMMKGFIQQPGKFGAVTGKIPMAYEHKTKEDLAREGISYPDEIVPPYVKEQGAFPVGVDDKGRVKYYNPGLPYQDLARLSPRELMSGLTPALKPLAEWMPKGGYSIFMDRPFESYKDQMVDAPLGAGALPDFLKAMLKIRTEEGGSYMPGETAAIINTLLPMLRTPQKLMTGEPEYTIPSEIFGQKFIPVDPKMERRATLYEWLKKIEESRKVEKGIEKKEGTKSLEGSKGEPLTLDEIIRLRGLHYGPKGIKP